MLKSVLPQSPPPPSLLPAEHTVPRRQITPTQPEATVAITTPPTVSVGDMYETPKRRPDEDDEADIDDDDDVEKDAQFGPVADSYLNP